MCPWCVLALVLLCLRSTHYPGTMQRIWIFATTNWLALLNTGSHLGHKREVQCHRKRDLSRVLRVGRAPLKSSLYLPVSREKAVFLLVSFESRKKMRNIWLGSCQAYASSTLLFISIKEQSIGKHSVVDEAQHYAEWKKPVTEDQWCICPGHRDRQRQRVGYWGERVVNIEGNWLFIWGGEWSKITLWQRAYGHVTKRLGVYTLKGDLHVILFVFY